MKQTQTQVFLFQILDSPGLPPSNTDVTRNITRDTTRDTPQDIPQETPQEDQPKDSPQKPPPDEELLPEMYEEFNVLNTLNDIIKGRFIDLVFGDLN